MSKSLNSYQPTGAFVMRVILGICMVHYGYPKVVPHGALDATGHYISGLHLLGFRLPYWLGYISALTEFIGGILLILGLLTRFAAVLVAINMIFALALVGVHNGPNMYFYQLSLFANALMLMLIGGGSYSSTVRSASTKSAAES